MLKTLFVITLCLVALSQAKPPGPPLPRMPEPPSTSSLKRVSRNTPMDIPMQMSETAINTATKIGKEFMNGMMPNPSGMPNIPSSPPGMGKRR